LCRDSHLNARILFLKNAIELQLNHVNDISRNEKPYSHKITEAGNVTVGVSGYSVAPFESSDKKIDKGSMAVTVQDPEVPYSSQSAASWTIDELERFFAAAIAAIADITGTDGHRESFYTRIASLDDCIEQIKGGFDGETLAATVCSLTSSLKMDLPNLRHLATCSHAIVAPDTHSFQTNSGGKPRPQQTSYRFLDTDIAVNENVAVAALPYSENEIQLTKTTAASSTRMQHADKSAEFPGSSMKYNIDDHDTGPSAVTACENKELYGSGSRIYDNDLGWKCCVCSYVNTQGRSDCAVCSCVSVGQAEVVGNQDTSWQCKACTFINTQNLNVCKVCEQRRVQAFIT
jgi:hypothetical protein